MKIEIKIINIFIKLCTNKMIGINSQNMKIYNYWINYNYWAIQLILKRM